MMKKLNNPNISNAILWAAAILSAAILDAPQFLTIIILPVCGLLSIINVKRCRQQGFQSQIAFSNKRIGK